MESDSEVVSYCALSYLVPVLRVRACGNEILAITITDGTEIVAIGKATMVLPSAFSRSRMALARYDVSPHMAKWWKHVKGDNGMVRLEIRVGGADSVDFYRGWYWRSRRKLLCLLAASYCTLLYFVHKPLSHPISCPLFLCRSPATYRRMNSRPSRRGCGPSHRRAMRNSLSLELIGLAPL